METPSNLQVGLYGILFQKLKEIKKQYHRDIISFPHLFEKICRQFSINKKQCWELMFLLREFGLVEIINGHGIRVVGKMD